jgi:hypothetical protein
MCFPDISVVVVGGTSTGPVSSVNISPGTVSSVSVSTGLPNPVSSVGISSSGLATPISMEQAALYVGAQGSQGVPGATGPQGATGPKGDKGDTGERGATGPAGSGEGGVGATGATGPQGVQGVTGATGPQGVTGEQGIPGATGSQGVTGSTGATGSQGVTGAIGFRYLYTSSGTGQSANGGVNFGAGYMSGNYGVAIPHDGSNTLFLPATDYSNSDRSNVYEFFDSLPGTGIAGYQGHLYVQSMQRDLISVYRIGSISRIGPYSGATACYVFNWSSGQEGSATGSVADGVFGEGELFAVYYVPGGQQGAQGAQGAAATITTLDGGLLNIAIP